MYLKLLQPMFYNRSNLHQLFSLQSHREHSGLGQTQSNYTRTQTERKGSVCGSASGVLQMENKRLVTD